MILLATPAAQIAPVASPVEECAWCWPLLHPEQPYPEEWSSAICTAHMAVFERQRAARRERLAQQAFTHDRNRKSYY